MVDIILDANDLEKLKQEIWKEFSKKLNISNRYGEIGKFLQQCELEDSLQKYEELTNNELTRYSNKPKYVLIAGDSHKHKTEEIKKVFKKYNINDDEIELCLGYEYFKERSAINEKFAYKQDKYKLILIGEIPHKVKGIEGHSSAITCLESDRIKYPRVVRLTANSQQKFTLSALDEKLQLITNEEKQ